MLAASWKLCQICPDRGGSSRKHSSIQQLGCQGVSRAMAAGSMCSKTVTNFMTPFRLWSQVCGSNKLQTLLPQIDALLQYLNSLFFLLVLRRDADGGAVYAVSPVKLHLAGVLELAAVIVQHYMGSNNVLRHCTRKYLQLGQFFRKSCILDSLQQCPHMRLISRGGGA